MANMAKITGVVLVLAVLASGCAKVRKPGNEEIKLTGAGWEKVKLLDKIEHKYGDSESHYQLGKLYYSDGLWDKAEFEYNVTLGFDPVHHRAQAAMVNAVIGGGNKARAKLLAEIYMNQVSTSAEASFLLGQAFQKELRDKYAMACYQQALALAPNSAGLHKQIGYYYLSKRDLVRAEEYLKRSFQLDPYQAEVAGELGRLGIVVRIPRKIVSNTKKLDKIISEQRTK